MPKPHLQTFTVLVRDEATARTVASLLAARGHLLVTARPHEPGRAGWWGVDSLVHDPAPPAFLAGAPALDPEPAALGSGSPALVSDPAAVGSGGTGWGDGAGDGDGWWRLHRWEFAAVRAIAREFDGLAYRGGAGRDLAAELGNARRDGLLADLTATEAAARRTTVLATFPPPAPALPEPPALHCVALDGGAAELDAVREHIARHQGADYPLDLLEEAEEHEEYDQHDELGAWQEEETTAGSLLAELFDEALHQGACYPWTAARVPLFADLAVDERLTDHLRAVVLLDLYAIATVGRTHLVATADELHALGDPAVPTPDAVAARAAVAEALPRAAARRHDSELYAYLTAALAAACPEAAACPIPELQTLARRWTGTARGPAAALILALATDDPAATEAALGTADPAVLDQHDSPWADPAHRALAVLGDLLEPELDRSARAS